MFMSNIVLTSGYRTLGSNFKLDNSFLTSKDGFAVCEFSRACLTHCLTYQIAIDPAYAHLFDEYYSKSLRMFREEIAGPLDIGDSALYFGGTFMCIISVGHSTRDIQKRRTNFCAVQPSAPVD